MSFSKVVLNLRNVQVLRVCHHAQQSLFVNTAVRHLAPLPHFRPFSQQKITKNLQLWKPDAKDIKTYDFLGSSDKRPLVILLAWLMADKKHIAKYADIYFKLGCDVLIATITPWQIIWPVKGSQCVADDILNYLYPGCLNRPMLLHGFSVGGYVWGEVLVKMNDDLQRYKPLIDQIYGQTWDSAADITELQRGLPFALFPKNKILRTTLEKYVGYHLSTFYDAATRHYLRASQMFHTTPVRAPALIFVSKTDYIGSEKSNMKCKESWDSMGMKTYWKCWDKSKHVSHMLLHREEYLRILHSFLESLKSSKDEVNDSVEMKIKL